MKPLTLTEQHKAKLLEMIKVLFSEYTEVELTSCFPYFNCSKNTAIRLRAPKFEVAWIKNVPKDVVSLWIEDKDAPGALTIHWLEFVLTYLAQKIYSKLYTGDLRPYFAELAVNAVMESIEGEPAGYDHPVDYLYKQFKLLKL